MEKITLEQFTPETKNIIQWVNAFNYEEELNKNNKFDNIKITKTGIKISDFFIPFLTCLRMIVLYILRPLIKRKFGKKCPENKSLAVLYTFSVKIGCLYCTAHNNCLVPFSCSKRTKKYFQNI